VVTRYTVDGKPVHPDPNHPGAPEDPNYWAPFLTKAGSYVDQIPNTSVTPYYEAKWNVELGRWVTNGLGHVGSGPDQRDATMNDTPQSSGNFVARFEVFAVGIDDGKIYGGVTWGVDVTPGDILYKTVTNPDGTMQFVVDKGGPQVKLDG